MKLLHMRLTIRLIPILLVSIFLSFFLDVNLLVISGILFCYLIYILEKTGPLTGFHADIKKLIFLSVFFTLGSKILVYLKEIFLTHDSFREAMISPIIYYRICSLSVSYQAFGFIKRGLVPAIVQWISSDYVVQIYVVQGIGFGIFIAGLLSVYKKSEVSLVLKAIYVAVLLLSPIGIYSYFNFNFGFYDMIIIGLLLISISYSDRRASVFFDIIGLLVHEAYIFLRLPFLIFQLFSNIHRKKPYTSILVSIVINITVLILISKSPRPGLEELKANYFASYPSLKTVTTPGDMLAFMPLCREATLSSDIKEIQEFYLSPKAASLYIPLSVSLLTIALLGYFTNRNYGKRRIPDVLASLFAFAFPLLLAVVGGDFGRWLGFSYITWATYYLLFRPNLFPETKPSFKYLYGVLLVALIFSPFGINYNPLFFKLMGH